MRTRVRLVPSVLAIVVASSVLLSAAGQLSSATSAIQLQLADLLYNQADYRAAMGVYQRVAQSEDPAYRLRGSSGTIRSALRLAEFRVAASHAAGLRAAAPGNPDALALVGDAMWASGLFDEAEAAYSSAVERSASLARGHYGMARVLATKGRLDEALNEAQAALRDAPRDPDIQQVVGYVNERLHRFDEAAAAYTAYLDLLSPFDRGDKTRWARAQINFLRSFSGRKPFEIISRDGAKQHTIPFRLVNDKIVIPVKVNGEDTVDFTVDTGAEQTVVTARTAKRLGLTPMGETLSAGVGLVGLRGVQMSRLESLEIGSLTVRNISCLIKTPSLQGMSLGELDGLSPLAFGLSMTVDYKNRRLTIGEQDDDRGAAYELPLRMHRLATVQGRVNGQPASFIVDTGGQVISLNTATARALFQPVDRRRIALRVYGTSGLDPDAYLLPGVSLAFSQIKLPTQPVVVLNLRAPSVLLGYDIGGIVGHKFLKNYSVEFDLQQSVLRLREM